MLGFNPYEMNLFWQDWGIPIEVIFFGKIVTLSLIVMMVSGFKRLYDQRRAATPHTEQAAVARTAEPCGDLAPNG